MAATSAKRSWWEKFYRRVEFADGEEVLLTGVVARRTTFTHPQGILRLTSSRLIFTGLVFPLGTGSPCIIDRSDLRDARMQSPPFWVRPFFCKTLKVFTRRGDYSFDFNGFFANRRMKAHIKHWEEAIAQWQNISG